MARKHLLILAAAASAFVFAACSPQKPAEEPAHVEAPVVEAPAAPGDLVAVASGAGNFTKLVAAVQAAGLVETLQGAGPFTVFAPNDDAFAKIPAADLEGLLKPEAKDKLSKVLTYHVVASKIDAASIAEGETKVKTVQGGELVVVKKGADVTVNGAKVVAADIPASNGVIHVIDTVVMPK